MNIKETIVSIFIPTNIMWYLWVLIIYYIFFGLFYRIIKNEFKALSVFFFVSLLFSVIVYNHPMKLGVKNLFVYLVFFYIGILSKKHLDKIEKHFKTNYTIYCGLFSVLIAILYLFNYNSIKANIFYLIIMNYLSSFLMIAFLFLLFNICKLANNRILIRLGCASLVIYLSHTYIVTAIKYVVVATSFDHPIVAVLFTWIVTTLLSYFIFTLSKKNKYVGYIFNPIGLYRSKYKK